MRDLVIARYPRESGQCPGVVFPIPDGCLLPLLGAHVFVNGVEVSGVIESRSCDADLGEKIGGFLEDPADA